MSAVYLRDAFKNFVFWVGANETLGQLEDSSMSERHLTPPPPPLFSTSYLDFMNAVLKLLWIIDIVFTSEIFVYSWCFFKVIL